MREHLKFWWVVLRKPSSLFRYDVNTGYGYGVESYDVLRDEVQVRVSQFGYVQTTHWIPRAKFLAHGQLLSETRG